MPELPEVETTRRGIEPHCLNQVVRRVIVREARLRWPAPDQLAALLSGQVIEAVQRRAKYLLFRTAAGSLMVHLGMSGSLRLVDATKPPGRHDHIDILFDGGAAYLPPWFCSSNTLGVAGGRGLSHKVGWADSQCF